MLKGTTSAVLQVLTPTVYNDLGEPERDWEEDRTIIGWLDYIAGTLEGSISRFYAPLEQSTHCFLCDYHALDGVEDPPERLRLVVGRKIFQVLLLDDPMGMHHHWEIYLKHLGERL